MTPETMATISGADREYYREDGEVGAFTLLNISLKVVIDNGYFGEILVFLN